jgi:glycosyltransferase involved in cell wall biosynthesis
MPYLSVLLSVRNEERRVRAAVDSIRLQSWTDWELIIVNDASADHTGSILRELAALDERIRLVQNVENRGLAASLNAAFGMASGELIARMDGDDKSLSERFTKQIAFLQANPDIHVVGTAAYTIDGLGMRTGVANRRITHDELVAHIYRESPFIHPSVMLRRQVLSGLGGYDEGFRRSQDYDLWLRGCRRFRYHNLEEPLLEYTPPRQATWASSSAGARAVWRAGLRDRVPLRGAFFALRLLTACALARPPRY